MPHDVTTPMAQLGGYWPALVAVLPALQTAARIMRRSTSAGLFGRTPEGGCPVPTHVYAAVQDGTDVERFLKTLHARCWLGGFGWMMVGAGGQLLERSIVDRMVGAPERLALGSSHIAESRALSYGCSTSTRRQHTHAHQPLASRAVRQPCRTRARLA
jgi:hypothetical protein